MSYSKGTLAVGAYSEDSSLTGVTNGSSINDNNLASNSGAVYVYQLEGRSQALISSGDPVSIGATNTALNIQVGGSGITHYRYKLGASPLDCSDASGYSGLISVSTPITDNLSGLADGSVTLCVVGVGGYGTQSYADATEYTWVKDTVVPSAPTNVTLVSPLQTPSNENNIVVGVDGLTTGQIVLLYSDASCSQLVAQKKVVSSTENISIQLDSLGEYKYYARSTSTGGNKSACSVSYASYYFNERWVHQSYIKASNVDAGDYFGHSVSLYNDTLAVGAIYEDTSQTTITNSAAAVVGNNSLSNSGAVYIYKRTGFNWAQEAFIKASNSGVNDYFGYAISLDQDTLVVGAYLEDSNQTTVTNGDTPAPIDNSLSDSGAVYVYKRTGNSWVQEAYIKASNAGSTDYFGSAVSLSQDTLAVGAYQEDSNQTTITNGAVITDNNLSGNSGAVYVYKRIGNNWAQEAYIKASNAGSADYFGSSVALDQDTLAVGAYGEDSNQTTITNGNAPGSINNTLSDSGAVYVYKRTGSNWDQEAYIKAANSGNSDIFGRTVSLNQNTLAVGAYYEDSNQTTITNGSVISEDNSLSNSGAVYVYKRTGNAWAQEAYIKASNAGASDQFGYSISLHQDMLVVGSINEDSSQSIITNGVTPPVFNDSSTNSGAVYVYKRNGVSWTQQAYIKSWNSGSNDNFGYSVGVYGATIAVGAVEEDSSQGAIVNGGTVVENNNASGSGAVYVYYYEAGVKADFTNVPNYINATLTNLNLINTNNTLVSYKYKIGAAPLDCSDTAGYSSSINASTPITADLTGLPDGTVVLCVIGYDGKNEQSYHSATQYSWVKDTVAPPKPTLVLSVPSALPTNIRNPILLANNTNNSVYTKIYSDAVCSQLVATVDTTGNSTYVSLSNLQIDVDYVFYARTFDSVGNLSPCSDVGVIYKVEQQWQQQAYIKAVNSDSGDLFGTGIAIDGDTLVVGAPGESSDQTTITNGPTAVTNNFIANSGAVYVYKRRGVSWTQEAYIKAANPDENDSFGNALALHGDTLIVGANKEDSSQTTITNGSTVSSNNAVRDNGALYVYKRTGTTWTQQAYIKSHRGLADVNFGSIVSLYDDTIVVGDNSFDDYGTDSGLVYVYQRNGNIWSLQTTLNAYNAGGSDGYGSRVSLYENTLAVSAPGEDSNQTTITNADTVVENNALSRSGAVYVYTRSGVSWTQQAYIKASNANVDDALGGSLSLYKDYLAVGSVTEDSNQTTITNGGAAASSNNTLSNSGAVYIYKRTGSNWAQDAYIKASNSSVDDYFGTSVALQENLLAVGSDSEDSNQTVITNGLVAPVNDNAANSGAVYIYRRGSTGWWQEAYIKASNSNAGDLFGLKLSLSKQTLAVAATREASNATAVINGEASSSDNSLYNVGAVYVYSLSQSSDAVIHANAPTGTNNIAWLNIYVGGSDIVQYKYKLGLEGVIDCQNATGYSNWTSVSTPITDDLSEIPTGKFKLCLIGQTSTGALQSVNKASEYIWSKVP